MRQTLAKIKRGLKKPPGYVVERLLTELRHEADRYLAPARAARFGIADLLAATGDASLDALCERILAIPYVAVTSRVDMRDYERICPSDTERVLAAAEKACAHVVDLLGSGSVHLGGCIDWLQDYKTGIRWPEQYFRDIDYNNPDRPSDVKFPWELSRMQWLIPCGQAFLLTGDEKYAQTVRDVLATWMESNPFGGTVNWSCTMEVALRIVTWTWFFHVFARTASWAQSRFREQFLRSLYLHALFTERNLEKSDINGNHYIADAAGLAFAGAFFGAGADAQRWTSLGWEILTSELPKQVFADGVDYEGSIPYHRLVFEIFLLPALLRRKHGLEVSSAYWTRLEKMANFTAAYSRADGSVPLVGDADDGRVLPFGGQGINDHRYLLGLAACSFAPRFMESFSGPRSEAFWMFGESSASLPSGVEPSWQPVSAAFPEGGFYVLRNDRDHIFIDCGPVGLAGRGGHGHNDLLSFEAVLNGVHLITDCGSYVYTADYAARQRFRSTAAHNTPQINNHEMNPITLADLWSLDYKSTPGDARLDDSELETTFIGSRSCGEMPNLHFGIRRQVTLNKAEHSLAVIDSFSSQKSAEGPGHVPGKQSCSISERFHLAPGITVAGKTSTHLTLSSRGSDFQVAWEPEHWALSVLPCEISPSYGVIHPSLCLVWTSDMGVAASFRLRIRPCGGDA